MKRYERPRLYSLLLDGVDVLTNMHANTTIPEICGVAAAYEVTGEERYRKIVEAYWEQAVDKRGCFVTGGQTSGEIWTPPFEQASRLGIKNQEFCVVYNMMRLSQYLYRWTGDGKYADYWEKNLYNGIFVQSYYEDTQNQLLEENDPQRKGHLAYYLPLAAGSKIAWGNETDHFWCCHCTMVQANASFNDAIFFSEGDVNFQESYANFHESDTNFREGDTIRIAQYLPAEFTSEISGVVIKIRQEICNQAGKKLGNHAVDRDIKRRPDSLSMKYTIKGGGQVFTVKFRKPEWLVGDVSLHINDEEITEIMAENRANEDLINMVFEEDHISVTRKWSDDTVSLVLPMGLRAIALPDRTDTVAFQYGPVALAGLCAEERTIYGDINNPDSFMAASDERWWNRWRMDWRTVEQPVNFPFIPMYDIGYKTYTVYFPVRKNS